MYVAALRPGAGRHAAEKRRALGDRSGTGGHSGDLPRPLRPRRGPGGLSGGQSHAVAAPHDQNIFLPEDQQILLVGKVVRPLRPVQGPVGRRGVSGGWIV